MIVIDANTLIALFDPEHRVHAAAATIMAQTLGQPKLISVVTLAEATVHGALAGRLDEMLTDAQGLGIRTAPVEADAAARLSNLRGTTRLKMPDVIVLDLAIQNQASLATFDTTLAATARTKGLTVIGG